MRGFFDPFCVPVAVEGDLVAASEDVSGFDQVFEVLLWFEGLFEGFEAVALVVAAADDSGACSEDVPGGVVWAGGDHEGGFDVGVVEEVEDVAG